MKYLLFIAGLLSAASLYSQDRPSVSDTTAAELKNVFESSIHSYGIEGLTDTLGSAVVVVALAANAPFLIRGSYLNGDPVFPAGLALWGSASLVLAVHGPLTISTVDYYGKRLKTPFSSTEEEELFRIKMKNEFEALSFRRKAGGLLLASAGALLALTPLIKNQAPSASDPLFTLGGTLILRGLTGLIWQTEVESYLESL